MVAATWVLCVTLDRNSPDIDRSPYGACDLIARGLTEEQCHAELREWIYRALEWEWRSHLEYRVSAACVPE